jgi:sulfur carrier protein
MSTATHSTSSEQARSTSSGQAATITFRVNDEPRTLAGGTTLADLVRDLGFDGRKGVAVAVNNSVVPRASWPTHLLAGGDRVLVIRAAQGG